MDGHPAFAGGNVAVITGAASGIGLAAAKRLASAGMKVVMADLGGAGLTAAMEAVAAVAADGGDVLAVPTDVSRADDVQALQHAACGRFGAVDVLMNNAAIDKGGATTQNYADWRRLVDVNFFGVLNGVQAFVEPMVAQGTPGLVINTGSKQGITLPPGNAAYNVAKAGVKALTECLAHELRTIEGCRVTAHLLVPGFTFTGLTRADKKPDAAWSAEQVVDFMLARISAGDFYVICPDNAVTREMDNRRMAWAMGDLIENRPALSRWHPDFKDQFEAFLRG